MKIFITGINGFLGSSFARHFQAKGYKVSGSTSSQQSLEQLMQKGFSGVVQPLAPIINPELLEGSDVVIHCAYDFKKNSRLANIEGTKAFYRAANIAKVKQQIFISSYSAIPDSLSEYGQIKFELEQFFSEQQALVLKPGLVIGAGGLFQRISHMLSIFPVIPLIDGGKGKMAIIGIDDLCAVTEKLLVEQKVCTFNLYLNEKCALKDFCSEIKKQSSYSSFFINVPFALLYFPIAVLSAFRIPFPITTQNLLGFKQNQAIETPSDLDSLLENSQSLSEMIQSAIKTTKTKHAQKVI